MVPFDRELNSLSGYLYAFSCSTKAAIGPCVRLKNGHFFGQKNEKNFFSHEAGRLPKYV
jgi:hypothetical protein